MTQTDPRLTALVGALPATVPFVGPETQERARDRVFTARLGANESVFGPSPAVRDAIARTAPDAWKYGDPEAHDLRAALARHHGVPIEAIIAGEGIDGLLGYLVRAFVAPGDAVVTSDGAYPTFNYHVAGFGGALHKVPYLGDHEDGAALLAKAAETGAKLIYMANPDNPMGSWHDAAAIQRLIDAVPSQALLVLDEAYGDTAPLGTLPPLDPEERRVIRMRTFSKAYGIAGMRVGYAIGHPDVIAAFHRIRNHFGLGRVSQAAALAALTDQAYLAATIARIAASREKIAQIARANGLAPLPSATNFVAIDCGADGAYARSLVEELAALGIFTRMPFVAPQDRCIRVSSGTDFDLKHLATALPKALQKLG
ncbi:MAG: pyridoxal phosphate-dependent aminotransferase [Pseudomonadota bacterium]